MPYVFQDVDTLETSELFDDVVSAFLAADRSACGDYRMLALMPGDETMIVPRSTLEVL